MSFRKNLFKNIVVLGGYAYTSQFIHFLSTIILSRLLLPEEYGFVALITVFTGFINTFSDAGLSYLIIRSDHGKLFQRVIHYLSFIIGIILFLIIVLLAYPISLFYNDSALILPTLVMSINFILRSLTHVPYGLLSKDLKFHSLGSLQLICTTIEIAFMIAMAFLGFSYWALIIPVVLGNIARIIMYYAKTRIRLKVFKFKYLVVGFREARSIIGNLSGFTLINYWARNSDNLIIGKVFGAESLGIYNRAYRMLNVVLSIMTGLFGKVLYPSLKDLMSRGGNTNKEYLNLLGIISLINYPVAILLIFFSEPMVRILWSDRWILVAELLPYIGVLILTQTLNSTTGNIFILYQKERMLFRLGLPVNIILVLAIVAGAIFSYVHILRFYALAFILVNLPLVVHYGFRVSFGFDYKEILPFWIPKISLSVLMIVSIWIKYEWVTIFLALIYLIHLVIMQREDFAKVYRYLVRKIYSSKEGNK
ncbi:MAG: oligosaccharide flippase family protein [Bacteroidales bacterium]|nr:oligosaccharide flippase family protein [Bacteroidales bacterium]